MMQVSRGTYRIERRLLEDPLKPYIAPIRCLPSFHMPWEYSTETLPILPPVRVFYPEGYEAFGWYGAREPRNDAALRKMGMSGPTQSNVNTGVVGDVKIVKKRRQSIKAEDKRRESRRNSASPQASSTSSRASSMTEEPAEYRKRVKLEPVDGKDPRGTVTRTKKRTTIIIKQEPSA